MKAVVWTAYGPPEVLQIKEVPLPAPGDREVLIRVHATTVTAGDCEMRSLRLAAPLRLLIRAYNGLGKPRRITILGQELAGEVEAAGKDVTLFKNGDRVFAAADLRLGSYAEYICLPEDGVVAAMPTNMTYEEAAAVPVGGLNALHFTRRSRIQTGRRVLINGAGGSIGTFAVQLAKSFGAEVTCVDSTGKLDMLRSLGADRVIDYTQEDFTGGGQTYDVILDLVGKGSISGCMRSLTSDGRYLVANPTLVQTVRGRWASVTSGRQVMSGTAPYKAGDLVFLRELIEAGKIKSTLDRRYPLERIVEAHRYVEAGHKKGNVVVTVVRE